MLLVQGFQHPVELYIQADNCWKENKNRWVLGFCSWLVMRGMFRKVHLSFLLQGHTHEDVDQLFVGISSKYLRTVLWTLTQLLELVQSAYPTVETRPTALLLPFVHDWKSYFNPVLTPMQGHSGPHVFTFTTTENLEVGMFYKDFHSSVDQLRGGEGSGGFPVLSGLPIGVPALLQPNYLPAAEIDQIPALFGMPGVTQETRAYWTSFMETQIPPGQVPDNYFDFERMKLPRAPQHHFVIPLPPSGFEVEEGSGYQSESSLVRKYIVVYVKINIYI